MIPHSPTWCPGCGNYGIWAAIKTAIKNLSWNEEDYVMVYGVGCSGNMTDFIRSYGFHSLHGRALPNAEGIKTANHNLNVICEVGDGDCYGEGGNHLIHAMRGNMDIKVFVHDNRVYGLTTGQTAPTSPKGYKSKSTPQGVIEVPINPLVLGITQGASLVAQGFAGDTLHLIKLMERVLQHKGFGLLNILQPCVTFNKINTYQYYRDLVYKQEKAYSYEEKMKAIEAVSDAERIPLGIIYQSERPTYQSSIKVLEKGPLVIQSFPSSEELSELLGEFTEKTA